MSCFDNYITISSSTPSRSGRYAVNLPGVSEELLDEIKKEQHADAQAFWDETVYPTSYRNLVSDVLKILQEKFFVNLKLVSRNTSEFLTTANTTGGDAGIRLEFTLPRYARIRVIKIQVDSNAAYSTPEGVFEFKDAETGEVLLTETVELTEGKNTINIDTDFEVDKLLIVYDNDTYDFNKTENEYFRGCDEWTPTYCEWCYSGGSGFVTQVNGGGINVIYNIYCSAEKFVCENINLFETALYYRIGLEIINERVIGEALNKYTVMTKERADELFQFYQNQYQQELENAMKAHNIYEDPYCFECKPLVNVQSALP